MLIFIIRDTMYIYCGNLGRLIKIVYLILVNLSQICKLFIVIKTKSMIDINDIEKNLTS